MPYRVDARGVSVTRGGKTILHPVSLSLSSGELVALLGPSGSGKSTLLRAMIGFSRGTGRVHVSGRDLYAEFESMKRLIGYVPQDDVLHTSLTVERTLAYAAELRLPEETSRETREAAVTAVLAQVGLSDRRGVRVRSLSGGQRKRVSIAIELLARPSLFFLDEPTSGLDPELEERMMGLFRSLTGPDRLTVVTTHVLASLHLADLAVIIARGRLVFIGPPKEAPAFFGASDFTGIYKTLATTRAEDHARALERTGLYRTYVTERLGSAPPPWPAAPPQVEEPARGAQRRHA